MSNRKQSSKLKKYKIKTNKAAKKRFKVSANGKVSFYPTGHKHLMSAKSGKKRRHSRRMKPFLAKHDQNDVIRMLQDQPGV
ncbi:MAG TPA: 50S ribosomal protein L35 [Planctomycetota bacterium]|nr:50S ribosomal protein L35 [Planctomycetota bacterium]